MSDLSITNRAYREIRREIIDCNLIPGSRLNISLLQERLTFSQAAVREALSRLTAEGLVEIERHRGFRVAPVSMSGFRNLMQACLAVELPCLRSSIENGDLEWELNLVSTYHRAVRRLELVVAGREDVFTYSNERLGFYEALLASCDNSWMLWSWRLLYAQNMRYRHVYMPLAKFELDQNPLHDTFVKMVLARNVKKAVELSVANYDSVIRFIESQLDDESPAQLPCSNRRPQVAASCQPVPVLGAPAKSPARTNMKKRSRDI